MKDKSQDEILKIAKKQDKENIKKQRKEYLGDARNDKDVQKTNYEESIKLRGKDSSITKQEKRMLESDEKIYDDLKII